MQKSNELVQRMLSAGGAQGDRITVNLDRAVVGVLERYRAREVGNDGRTRRQSLGNVATALILAADELLMERAAAGKRGGANSSTGQGAQASG